SLRRPTDGLGASLDLGEVDSEGQQAVFAGLPPKIVHERLQSVFGDVYEGDPKAFADERARDHPTETTGRAGDDCHFAYRHLSLGCLAQDLFREAFHLLEAFGEVGTAEVEDQFGNAELFILADVRQDLVGSAGERPALRASHGDARVIDGRLERDCDVLVVATFRFGQ